MFIFRVLSFAFDLDFDDDAPDFRDNGGLEDGGFILFCDMSP